MVAENRTELQVSRVCYFQESTSPIIYLPTLIIFLLRHLAVTRPPIMDDPLARSQTLDHVRLSLRLQISQLWSLHDLIDKLESETTLLRQRNYELTRQLTMTSLDPQDAPGRLLEGRSNGVVSANMLKEVSTGPTIDTSSWSRTDHSFMRFLLQHSKRENSKLRSPFSCLLGSRTKCLECQRCLPSITRPS